jgi:glucose-6-phosphate isomerase
MIAIGPRRGAIDDRAVAITERRATATSLIRSCRPTRLIRMSRPDEKGLGVPLPHFTLKTVVAPDLQGVDAFDRSAVEEGKVLARQYHGEKASGGAQ